MKIASGAPAKVRLISSAHRNCFVKIVYRKADYEKDNVILTAFSFGGISKLDDDLVLSANLLSTVVPMYGVGEYDNITIQNSFFPEPLIQSGNTNITLTNNNI